MSRLLVLLAVHYAPLKPVCFVISLRNWGNNWQNNGSVFIQLTEAVRPSILCPTVLTRKGEVFDDPV